MNNFIEYSSNYSETTRTLWFYFKVETTYFCHNFESTDKFKYFKYKVKLLGNTVAQPAPNF